jgi:hypothetical protein
MRTAIRTIAALALAAPLAVQALPASAATSSFFREKGTFAYAFFEGETTPGNLPGNYTFADLSVHGTFVEGYVETFDCDPGEVPYGDENGDNACEDTGAFYAFSDDVLVTTSKGKGATTTYSGNVELYDATVQDGDYVTTVPFSITFTPTGGTARETFTDSYHNPVTGETYRVRETRVVTNATVEGDLGGVPAVFGQTGTYSVREVQRTA